MNGKTLFKATIRVGENEQTRYVIGIDPVDAWRTMERLSYLFKHTGFDNFEIVAVEPYIENVICE